MTNTRSKPLAFGASALVFFVAAMAGMMLARKADGYEPLMEKVVGACIAGGWMSVQVALVLWCRQTAAVGAELRAFGLLLVSVAAALFLKAFVQHLDFMVAELCVTVSLVLAAVVAAMLLVQGDSAAGAGPSEMPWKP